SDAPIVPSGASGAYRRRWRPLDSAMNARDRPSGDTRPAVPSTSGCGLPPPSEARPKILTLSAAGSAEYRIRSPFGNHEGAPFVVTSKVSRVSIPDPRSRTNRAAVGPPTYAIRRPSGASATRFNPSPRPPNSTAGPAAGVWTPARSTQTISDFAGAADERTATSVLPPTSNLPTPACTSAALDRSSAPSENGSVQTPRFASTRPQTRRVGAGRFIDPIAASLESTMRREPS